MNLKKIKFLLMAGIFIPAISGAVTIEDFETNTTKNLINLCTASTDDPQYKEAIHFCQGYMVGAYDYYYADYHGPDGQQLVCFPEPVPTRNAAIKKVVSWAQQHPEYMNEKPVETVFRALIDLWPCKK